MNRIRKPGKLNRVGCLSQDRHIIRRLPGWVYQRSMVATLSIVVLFVLSPRFVLAGEPNTIVGNFSQGDIDGWEQKEFNKKTDYSLVEENGATVIRAISNQSASGFYKQIRVDLNKTPILNWRWKVENILAVSDERTKAGDDYPARVYVIIKTGSWFWNLNAINYVWSSINPVGENWPNAVTSKAWVVAVASGSSNLGQWMTLKRNVQKDFQEYFNNAVQYIDSVAIMSDTDNSGGRAVAYYGDIYFSAE